MYNLVIHPPATSHTALKRLVQEVVDTHNSASELDIKFSKRVDEDALSVLKSDFFDARGLTHIWHYPHKEYELFIDFILEAKFRYPLKRPYALAKELGIPFHRRKNYIRARGNSYPSAHSASVWFVTYYLADKIPPHLKSELFAFAHKIANSRMVAGVHTRQDLDEGRLLAQKAVNMLKLSSFWGPKHVLTAVQEAKASYCNALEAFNFNRFQAFKFLGAPGNLSRPSKL